MKIRDDVIGADHFSASAQRIVDYLNAHTAIPDWSVSRVSGGEQVHVHVHEDTFLSVGQRVPWDETMCRRMYDGGSNLVPDVQADPVYADHAFAGIVRAYAGIPITDDEGNIFGTLCGVGTVPLDGLDAVDIDLIALMGQLLSSQLAMARSSDRDRRTTDITTALAHTDALTGLVNRRGWDLFVGDAQQRVDAYADPVAVAVIDLDGLKAVNDADGHQAGDELLRRTGDALRAVEQPIDRIARYGGDEFAILSNNIAQSDLASHFGRFVDSLAEQGVSASMGYAATNPGLVSLAEAFAAADTAMYATKTAKRS